MVIKLLVVIIILQSPTQSQSRGMVGDKVFFTTIQLSHKYVLSRLEKPTKKENPHLKAIVS